MSDQDLYADIRPYNDAEVAPAIARLIADDEFIQAILHYRFPHLSGPFGWLLSPLVKWVEQGVAPQAIAASARGAGNPAGANTELPADWSPQRSRPLCAYPTVAQYNGTGPVETASSFTCR